MESCSSPGDSALTTELEQLIRDIAPDSRVWGCLDGLVCSAFTFDQVIDQIPENFGDYELLDCVLHIMAPADEEHAKIIQFLQDKISVASANFVELVSSLQNVGVKATNARVIPDLTVHEGGKKKIMVEVTSTSTRKRDLIQKVNIYKEKFDEYWILDRFSSPKELITYSGRRWTKHEYKSGQVFEHRFIGKLLVSTIFDPPPPGTVIRSEVHRANRNSDEKRNEKERADRNSDERRKEKERADRNSDERRKEKERADRNKERADRNSDERRKEKERADRISDERRKEKERADRNSDENRKIRKELEILRSRDKTANKSRSGKRSRRQRRGNK